jgi:NUMOD3 motif
MIYHDHHFVPRHAGGTDDPSNIVRVTVADHVGFHYERWVVTGDYFDWLAWKALAGLIMTSEASRLAHREGCRRGGATSGKLKKGSRASVETRAKIRASKLGTTMSLETREKMSVAKVGRKLSAETREKIRLVNTGVKRSEEAREAMRAAWAKRRRTASS